MERHPGQSRITAPSQDRFLQATTRREPYVTVVQLVRRLQTEYQLHVNEQSVRRRLHKVNLHARRLLRAPPLRNKRRLQ